MKSLILCLIIITLGGSSAYGQYLLGLGEEEVKEKAKEFGGDTNITFKKTWYKDKAYALHWYDDQIECQVTVAFNPYTNLSVITSLAPVDEQVYEAIVSSFKEMEAGRGKDWWVLRVNDQILKVETVMVVKEKNLVFRGLTAKELMELKE